MPIETGRQCSLLKVVCPDADGADRFVYLPVIDEIVFTDQKEDGQEFNYIFLNVPGGTTRKVHVDTVENAGTYADTFPEAGTVDVEVIDEFTVLDAKSNAQEFTYRLSGNKLPPGNPQPEGDEPKLRYVRYTGFKGAGETPDPDIWIDVGVIDQLSVIDQKDDAQQRLLTLSNNPGKDGDPIEDGDPYEPVLVQADTGLELNEQTEAPWRLDPFQNVVNVQWWPVEYICFGLLFFTSWNIGGWGQYLPDGRKVMDIDHLNYVDWFGQQSLGGPDFPMPPNSLRHVQLQLFQWGASMYYHGGWHDGNVGMPQETKPTGGAWNAGSVAGGILEGLYVLYKDLFFDKQLWFIYGTPTWTTHCYVTIPPNGLGSAFTDSEGNDVLVPDAGSYLPHPQAGQPNLDLGFGTGNSATFTLRGVPYHFQQQESPSGPSYTPIDKTRDYINLRPYYGWPRISGGEPGDGTEAPGSQYTTYYKGDWIGDNGEIMDTDTLTMGGTVDYNGRNYNQVGWQISAGQGVGARVGVSTTVWSSFVYVLYQRELDQ